MCWIWWRSSARAKQLELSALIDADVPAQCCGRPGTRLRQVLLNLVGNAIKFTDARRSARARQRSTESATRPTSACYFEVKDTGIGMPLDALADAVHAVQPRRMPRRRGDTAAPDSASRSPAARRHDGRRGRRRERAGIGQHVLVHASLLDARVRASSRARSCKACGARSSWTTTRSAARVLAPSARATGATVECAADRHRGAGPAREARRDGAPFDLAVVDRLMPGLDGFDVARRVRADDLLARTALVLVTSGSHARLSIEARDAGFDAYLTRPLELQQLARRRRGRARRLERLAARGCATASARRRAARPGARVLLAEDNAVNQRVAMRMLTQLGIAWMSPPTVEALEASRRQPTTSC